jgi:hypothetical protein
VTQSLLEPGLSPRAILERVEHAEREAHDLLAEASRSSADSGQRALYARLADSEEAILRDLERERDLLDAEEFVQKAIDV